ncbi:MAG TPA: ATP-binding protein [Thermoanaerobaculia bacterium]|nr:ATP-binding protein [Thermoanaerobaculia bacterium]
MPEAVSIADSPPGAPPAPRVQSSEQAFRRLLEKLPAGAYTCDPQGLITFYNQKAAEIWGREPRLNDPRDRFCGSFKLYSTDGAAICHDECWMARAIQANEEYNGREMVIERPDGHRLTVLAHANPIRDESGALSGAVNVLIDISDRKRAENALRDADRSKDEFLATLAHELRNPLAPIRTAVEILHREGGASVESRWALEVIDRQMAQMTRLVDDLLDVSRITRDKLELRKGRAELAGLVRSAVETSRPLLAAGGHQLTVSVPPRPIFVDADPTRLEQALSNLLNNAAKYTPRGGDVSVTVERRRGQAAVTVRDTGIGIPPEMLPRIFDMFTQVDRSLERAQGGLGIGLTLARRLVEMHGGTIEAHSEGPGRGSSFTIRLPIAEASRAAAHAEMDDEPVRPGATLRILVVDDNRDAASTLGLLLELTGHEVRTAHDGLEAVAAASEFRPDVVLLDIGLPKLNGYEAARRIRRQPRGEGVVLIAITGWGQEEDKQQSKEAGFDQHIVKPVDPAALLKLISSFEQASAGGNGNGGGPHAAPPSVS